MTARANWRDDAACLDADPELFFPGRHGRTRAAPDRRGETDLPSLPGANPVPGLGAG
jgi:hypothetical protein